jgi:hypothetical protein
MNQASRRLTRAINRLFPSHKAGPKRAVARMRLAIDHEGFSAEACGLLCATFKPEAAPMLDLENVRREIARSVALP